ncbi:MAG: hypothetical protein A2542_02950 [Parcubacteria group bacterium RIFOXYD2_FULL_52_8]|nr:MAG: hypothetical protein A2542_02950 [Parcubacteria group bacterium RIFOXYD2_FULL_52_8]
MSPFSPSRSIFSARLRTLIDRDPLHFDESGKRPWGVLLFVCGVLLLCGIFGHYLLFLTLETPLEILEEQEGGTAIALDNKALSRALALYQARQKLFEALVASSSAPVVDPSL